MAGPRTRRLWLFILAGALSAGTVLGVGSLIDAGQGGTSPAAFCRRLDAAMNQGATLAAVMDLVTDELELSGNTELMTNVAIECPETHGRFVNYHHGG